MNAGFGGSYGPAKGMGPGSMKGGPPGPYSGSALGMPQADLNEDGLPVRPDKDECLLYKNTGSCKNGVDCIFHHPRKSESGKGGMMPIMSGPPPGLSDQPLGMSASPTETAGPPQGMMMPEASSNGPGSKESDKASSEVAEEKPEANGEEESKEPPQVEVQYNEEGLPIRPTMQKCGFYMRTGKCTYGPTCRFDHPSGLGGLLAGATGFGNYPGMIGGPMTQGGMAVRPGMDQCPFLKRTKSCPFGSECRFDHSVAPAADKLPDNAPKLVAPAPAPPLSRKKEKGLGGVRGRRNVPTWRPNP